MSYSAIVARVRTRPHPTADRLQLGICKGYQVVIGLDVEDNELGVFFPADGQLSVEMCEEHDLVGYKDQETGERKGGFFAKNRRVRSQRFRGEKSDGYWTPISNFEFTGYDVSTLVEGFEFTELNDVPICNKYFTPATLKAMSQGGMQARQNSQFAKHVDTEQLKHNVGKIPNQSILYVTEKLHGTSGRFGHVLDTENIPWNRKQRFWHFLTRRKPKTKTVSGYKYLIGTRNTILSDRNQAGYYGSEEFRWDAVEPMVNNLHEGEIVYFELTGYTNSGSSIMGAHHAEGSDLKDVRKEYGERIVYEYGQNLGTCGLWAYRITQVGHDGNVVELTWPQVKKRCRELGINHVPELDLWPSISLAKEGGEGLLESLEPFTEGASQLDPNHPKEGLVVRVERPDGDIDFLKFKSFTFGLLEGYIKQDDSYVDTEEIS